MPQVKRCILKILIIFIVGCCTVANSGEMKIKSNTNQHNKDRHLIVISAPSADTSYYKDVYEQIIAFDIAYAKAILGKDNVVVLGDKHAMSFLKKELPEDILLEASMRDIWMRDFSTINPHDPIQFRYTAAAQGGNQDDADWVQDAFAQLTDKLGMKYKSSNWILDGGNVVANHNDKVIVTDRFLDDNNLTREEAKAELQRLLGATQIAVIQADDPEGLAHADGMLMFIDDNTIVLNKYEEPFRSQVIDELESSFPEVHIIEIDAQFDDSIWDERFSSACGIYVNSLVTKNFIYLPIFGTQLDSLVVQQIQKHTKKEVIPINANNVCAMGGSVRCLAWQISGELARTFIEATQRK